jgi:P4 family phage/plasmid primase-like protien
MSDPKIPEVPFNTFSGLPDLDTMGNSVPNSPHSSVVSGSKISVATSFNEEELTNWELVESLTSANICRLFKRCAGDNFLYSRTNGCFYVFDNEKGIWLGGKENLQVINFQFSVGCHKIFSIMEAELPIPRNEEEQARRKKKGEIISKAKKMTDGSSAVQIVKNFLSGVYMDKDPAPLFNQNDDLLPLKNGVWSFSEKKLIPYEREHYFTFKIDINYNPGADFSDMTKAMNQWFNNDAEIVDFVHYYIGYCLTGYTSRQECLVAWGKKSCNGKSTLWADILKIIMGPYFKTLASESLSKKKTGNNDGLAQCEGKRCANIDEPEEESENGNGIKKSLFKNITSGKGEIEVSAKYMTAKEIKFKTKLNFSCNECPDFDFNDKGTNRRVVILEQNTEFVYPEQYALLSEEEKKIVHIRDDAFITKLLANKEGLIRWALEGSDKFMKDKARPVPKKLLEIKNQVKEDKDELGSWVRNNLTSSTETDLTVLEVKQFWKKYDMDFGQKKHGFNKKFLEECARQGYKTSIGRAGKSEEKILGCMRVETEEEKKMKDMIAKI